MGCPLTKNEKKTESSNEDMSLRYGASQQAVDLSAYKDELRSIINEGLRKCELLPSSTTLPQWGTRVEYYTPLQMVKARKWGNSFAVSCDPCRWREESCSMRMVSSLCSLIQHCTLAPTSSRWEVGLARSNQSAGHALP